MSQGTDGNEVHSGIRIGTNIFQSDSARAFQRDRLGTGQGPLDSLLDHIGSHIVEEDGVGAVGESKIEFVQVLDLDLNLPCTLSIFESLLKRGHDASGKSDVIVFDKHAVGEIKPMVLSATTTNGIFVEHAQADHSFAGVEDPGLGALDGVDKLPGHGCGAAEALQHVENDPFAREDDASVMANGRDHLSLVQPNAVEYFGMTDNLRMSLHGLVESGENLEDASNGRDAGEDALLLGANECQSELARIDAGARGGIVGGPVFQQGVFEDGGDSTAIPVHVS